MTCAVAIPGRLNPMSEARRVVQVPAEVRRDRRAVLRRAAAGLREHARRLGRVGRTPRRELPGLPSPRCAALARPVIGIHSVRVGRWLYLHAQHQCT